MENPKVGDIWEIRRSVYFFGKVKKGEILLKDDMRTKVLDVRYWSSEMDFHDNMTITLKRLPDKTWFEIVGNTLSDWMIYVNEQIDVILKFYKLKWIAFRYPFCFIFLLVKFYLLCLIFACAAASLAIGTLKGEHDT